MLQKAGNKVGSTKAYKNDRIEFGFRLERKSAIAERKSAIAEIEHIMVNHCGNKPKHSNKKLNQEDDTRTYFFK